MALGMRYLMKMLFVVATVFGFQTASHAANLSGDQDASTPEMKASEEQEAQTLSPRKRILKRRNERIERKYVETDEVQQCVSARSIRNTTILDDDRIFFRSSGNRGYMNTLNKKCYRLTFEDRFAYQVRGSAQICKGQIITVIDDFGRAGGSCSLGEFVKWEKKPKQEADSQ